MKNTPVLTSFYHQEVKPSNTTFMFKSLSKGDQLKLELANFKFPILLMDPSF